MENYPVYMFASVRNVTYLRYIFAYSMIFKIGVGVRFWEVWLCCGEWRGLQKRGRRGGSEGFNEVEFMKGLGWKACGSAIFRVANEARPPAL